MIIIYKSIRNILSIFDHIDYLLFLFKRRIIDYIISFKNIFIAELIRVDNQSKLKKLFINCLYYNQLIKSLIVF